MTTAQSQMSKSKLIETAADIVYRQGWNATGINQILGDAKVPKGSFYYYFHSKDDLGVAIVRHHSQLMQERCERTLGDKSLNGRQAIMKFFEQLTEEQSGPSGAWVARSALSAMRSPLPTKK